MSERIQSPENIQYRKEQAEKLLEIRGADRSEAIKYLGTLQLDPKYVESRRAHKNFLASVSNEKVAEQTVSYLECQVVLLAKRWSLYLARLLSDNMVGRMEEVELDDAKEDLQNIRYLEGIKEGVVSSESQGVSREQILGDLKAKSNSLFEEVKKLNRDWSETNNDLGLTDVTDVVSAVSSWFDGIREMIKDRKLDSLDLKSDTLADYYAHLKWVINSCEENPDIDVSVILDRIIISIQRNIGSSLLQDDFTEKSVIPKRTPEAKDAPVDVAVYLVEKAKQDIDSLKEMSHEVKTEEELDSIYNKMLAKKQKLAATLMEVNSEIKRKKLRGEDLSWEETLDRNALKEEFTLFLKETFKLWHIEEKTIDSVELELDLISPEKENYSARKSDTDLNKFGHFTLNPDTQGLDWESLKDLIFVPDLSSLVGKSFQEVAEYLVANYSDGYEITGLEFWKFMIENPDEVSDQLKDGNFYFNFGTLIRSPHASWTVPSARFDNSVSERNCESLDATWRENYRVVLLGI